MAFYLNTVKDLIFYGYREVSLAFMGYVFTDDG